MNELKNMDSDTKMKLDSDTLIYGVIGDPIRQSKSPIVQNHALQAVGVNAVYTAFHVKPEHVKAAIYGLRALGISGINVTAPHKIHVMEYLDEIDESARFAGAVNTIINKDGRLIGYNTDGIGYVRSLKEETNVDLKGKTLLLLGSGGAARGLVYALAKEEPEYLMVANRTKEKAIAIAEQIGSLCHIQGMGLNEIEHINKQKVDIVINTTSVGMMPNVNDYPIDPSWFHEGLIVSDIIYNPRTTKILQEAQMRGARIHGGLGMFIYQGAYNFEYFTGQPAPVELMRSVVESVI